MKFFWLTAFCGLSAGVILSPAFPLTSIVLLLLLFRKKSLALFSIFFFLGSLLATIHALNGTYEIVGYATIERSNYVIATNVEFFSNGEWRSIFHNVKLYSKETRAGETFYAFGKINFHFAYPPLTMSPNFVAGTQYGNRGFEKIRSKLFKFKQRVVEFFQDNAPDFSELFSTLIFSDPSFDASQAEKVRKSGLAHLFAVSGLHVGIVYVLFDVFISLFSHSLFVRRPLSVLFTLMFAAMTGPSPSALRAALMLAVWNFFKLIDYPIEPLNVLGFVATLNLLFEPYILLSPSFLMSYSAATTLVAAQDWLKNHKGIIANFLVSLFAFLGVAPFLLLFSTMNVLAPLISVPAVLLATPLLWASVLIMFLLTVNLYGAAAILVRGATPLAWAMQKLIDLLSHSLNMPGSFLAYLLSSALLLLLLWHFGQSPKNFTS